MDEQIRQRAMMIERGENVVLTPSRWMRLIAPSYAPATEGNVKILHAPGAATQRMRT